MRGSYNRTFTGPSVGYDIRTVRDRASRREKRDDSIGAAGRRA